MWVAKIFRTLFILLDAIVYKLVDLVYRLFIMISETGVFTPESIREFGNRIYVLLGVFMLFKVSFSLITYILNPDELTDKNKGVAKILQNFFVVLIGIVAVPYVFQAAYSLQSLILKENVIGSIIMGENANIRVTPGLENESDYIKRGGELMSFTTLSAFIRLNPNVVGEECSNLPVIYSEEDSENIINPVCEDYSDVFETELDSGETVGNLLINAYSNNDTALFTNLNLINLRTEAIDGEEDWMFDYMYLISVIAGGFMAWILFIFCIDIATRSVKLGFLQLIAPIPIISYIDPKSGKDGVFKKWLNECTKTYLDLFIRLIAIYFALYVVTIIVNGRIYNITTGATQKNIFVVILIIFGALMFAKDLPTLISNITGVKLSGGFTLNPMKKLGSSPFAAGAMGLVGGALGGMVANAYAAHKNGLGFRKGALSTLAGGASAGLRGAHAGLTSGGKGSLFGGAQAGIKASNQARYNRSIYRGNPNVPDSRYTWLQRRQDDFARFAGVKNKDAGIGQYDARMKAIKREMENHQGQEHALRDAMARYMAESGASFDKFDVNSLYKGGKKVIGEDGKPTYVTWQDYNANAGPLTEEQFKQFLNFQQGIDMHDAEYERLRKQYGQYEDAYNSRNAAKKDK